MAECRCLPLKDGVSRPTVRDRLVDLLKGKLPEEIIKHICENRNGFPMNPRNIMTEEQARIYVREWFVAHNYVHATEIVRILEDDYYATP